jgi:drug/metabolite transporter (DMT)-like permease
MEAASDSGNQTSLSQTSLSQTSLSQTWLNQNWLSQTWLGSLLIAASATAYSTAGFFTRLIDLDIWTVLFWRGLFAGLFIAAYVIWQNGRAAVRAIGRRGLWIAFFSTFATICFLNALRLTSVAEVTIINATSPFITGVLAWLFIGERERWTTVVASLFAFLGVIVMFDPGSSAGHLAGNLLAFAMTLSLAAMVVILRHSRATSMLPATCLSAFLCPIVVWPIANPGAASGMNFIYLALFGTIQFGLGLLLLTIGTRLVTAIRSSLIGRLQIPLAPAWVWLAFGEVPTLVTCVGGLVVVAAIASEAAIRKMEP